jgi:hypothetical protein
VSKRQDALNDGVPGDYTFRNALNRMPSTALFYLKAHLATFIKALESGHVDGGVVNKYVATIFLLNEAESFFVTEPLQDSFCQDDILLPNRFLCSQTSGGRS